MPKIFVRPAPGMKQRMPHNAHEFLPETGAEVERDAFWSRRLADGDVLAGRTKIPAQPKPAKE